LVGHIIAIANDDITSDSHVHYARFSCDGQGLWVGALRDWLDAAHSLYLNPYYQPDPSLWTQEACNNFNSGVDSLLALLQRELDSDYEILDQQVRYAEDPGLGEYLAANSEISAIEDIRGPMVRHGLPRSCKRDGR